MTGERVERRLAAVLAADIAGYSRLMGLDEEGTLARLKAVRKTLVDPTIAAHRGRIVKTTGDGMLVEFASAVDAARCAMEVQRGMAKQNIDVPQEAGIELRIGIHVGDIIIDDNDIFGDGVNIAARLEGIAEPGGVCISDDAQRQIRGKVDTGFDDMGVQTLKNIAEPMRAWRMRLSSTVVPPLPTAATSQGPALPLPDKPSIAVLPFKNMSGDPEQEYFADGMVEDIITALSRYPKLFVIARNSCFSFKGRAVDVKQVGRELGVRYVLEGSLRKSGNRVRVTAQLVEAETGNHVWAERYDRDLADIFAVQDEITQATTIAVAPAIADAEQQRAKRKPPASLDAWGAHQRGIWHFSKASAEDNALAEKFFQRAIDLDPMFVGGYIGLSAVLSRAKGTQSREEALARRAVALDGGDAEAHSRLALALLAGGDHQGARAQAERALTICPNLAAAHGALGVILAYSGRPKEGIAALETCIRLDPRDPSLVNRLNQVALARLIALGVVAHVVLLSTTTSYADPQEDFSKCVDAYVVQSIKSKPSLVDFAVTLDKLCTSEATKLINKDDNMFAPSGNAAMDALAEDTKLKLQQLGERYVKGSKDRAVAFYSKLQENWQKSGIAR